MLCIEDDALNESIYAYPYRKLSARYLHCRQNANNSLRYDNSIHIVV